MSTVFALWTGVNDGLAALVIVQAGVFADASRQLVRYVCSHQDYITTELI